MQEYVQLFFVILHSLHYHGSLFLTYREHTKLYVLFYYSYYIVSFTVTESQTINNDNKSAVTSSIMKEHLDRHHSSFLDDFIMLRTSTNPLSSLQPISQLFSGMLSLWNVFVQHYCL